MKQEVSEKTSPKTEQIPDWVKNGIPDLFWIVIVILGLFLITVFFNVRF
jgi:hypothetical protein